MLTNFLDSFQKWFYHAFCKVEIDTSISGKMLSQSPVKLSLLKLWTYYANSFYQVQLCNFCTFSSTKNVVSSGFWALERFSQKSSWPFPSKVDYYEIFLIFTWGWRIESVLVCHGPRRGIMWVSVSVHEGMLHMTG